MPTCFSPAPALSQQHVGYVPPHKASLFRVPPDLSQLPSRFPYAFPGCTGKWARHGSLKVLKGWEPLRVNGIADQFDGELNQIEFHIPFDLGPCNFQIHWNACHHSGLHVFGHVNALRPPRPPEGQGRGAEAGGGAQLPAAAAARHAPDSPETRVWARRSLGRSGGVWEILDRLGGERSENLGRL